MSRDYVRFTPGFEANSVRGGPPAPAPSPSYKPAIGLQYSSDSTLPNHTRRIIGSSTSGNDKTCFLLALRDDGRIGDAAFQRVEEELDWAEFDWAQLVRARHSARSRNTERRLRLQSRMTCCERCTSLMVTARTKGNNDLTRA